MIDKWLEEYQEEGAGIYNPQQIEAIRQSSHTYAKHLQKHAQTFFRRFGRPL